MTKNGVDTDLGFMHVELMHSFANQSIWGIVEQAHYALMSLLNPF